jgi:hypothetical protein
MVLACIVMQPLLHWHVQPSEVPMLSRVSFLACVAVLATSLMFAADPAPVVHVAPGGNDRASGDAGHPLRSLPRALEFVQRYRASHPGLADSVFIMLHNGRYPMSAALRLGPSISGTAASPTVIAAAPGASPVISGGVTLKKWSRTTIDGKPAWVTALPAEIRRAKPEVFELWVGGERRSPARYPNAGYLSVDTIPEITQSTDWMQGQRSFVAKSGVLPRGLDLTGGQVVLSTKWVESSLPIDRFEPAARTFRFARRSVFRIDPGDLFYIVHARGALDAPGEWWLDVRSGKLYYLPLPGEEIGATDAVVPVLEQVMRIEGEAEKGRWVEHVVFRCLTFSHTEWFFPKGYETDSRNPDAGGFNQAATGVPAAVACTGMRHVTFAECAITHVGTYGISLGAACQENTITRSTIADLGAGGVSIGLKTIENNPALLTQRNRLIDNHIHDGGKIFHSAIGVWIGQSPFNRIIHNHIHDFHYTGISIGWTWGYGPALAYGNIVELNHVHHIGILSDGDGPFLSDLGGIYTLGNQRGTEIRRNVFHDIAGRVYGGWGIYFDEGTTHIRAEENLVYRTKHGGFHQHYGKENIFRNNILAFGEEYQVARTRFEPHMSFAFEHNIILWNGGPVYFASMRDSNIIMDRNLYWPVNGAFRYDTLDFAGWQRTGRDVHSQIADPGFVDPAAGDFRLRDGSPALDLRFRPFDVAPVYSSVPAGDTTLPPRVTRRLVYNNDGSSIPMGFDSLTAGDIHGRVDPIAENGVTTFIYNVNPGQNPGYQSKVESKFHWADAPANPKEGWPLLGRRMSRNLERFGTDTLDQVRTVLDRARLRGMEAFLSFRMNELHDVDKPESPLLGEFWKAHPEWRVGGYAGWGKEALNYAVPEVRAYFLALVKEALLRYDMDGFELDLMRWPHYFPLRPDSMSHYAGILTELVGQVRSVVDSLSHARGHRILLTARVPSSLKGCAYMGADPATWCAKGYVDFLAIAPFLSTENDINASEFKAVCGKVPIYTAQEFTMGNRQMTLGEKRAAAGLHYASGADGVYLFNYFVAWDGGIEPDVEVLNELIDPVVLERKDKMYTLAPAWFPIPGVSLPSQMPLPLRAAQLATVTLRLHESMAPRKAILRIECSEALAPEDMRVMFNGTDLAEGIRPTLPQIVPERSIKQLPDVTKTLEFVVDPALLRDANRIGIHAQKGVTVEYVYLGVMH